MTWLLLSLVALVAVLALAWKTWSVDAPAPRGRRPFLKTERPDCRKLLARTADGRLWKHRCIDKAARMALVTIALLGLTACGGSGAVAQVTSTPTPTVASVTITGYAGTIIAPTFPTQLTATAHLSDGTSLDVTHAAVWASSAPTIATVSATGLLDGLLTGTAVISATYAGISGTVTVTVLSGGR